MAVLTPDQSAESKRCGGQFQILKDLGVLTDTNVAASNTVTALKAAIAAALVHADQRPQLIKGAKAVDRFVDLEYAGVEANADTAVAALTTVAGLIALTKAPVGFKQGFYQ